MRSLHHHKRLGVDQSPGFHGLLIPEGIASLFHVLRYEKVILDSDLAELYGVTTKVLDQAIQRNIDRFPPDFMFQLTEDEWEHCPETSGRRPDLHDSGDGLF